LPAGTFASSQPRVADRFHSRIFWPPDWTIAAGFSGNLAEAKPLSAQAGGHLAQAGRQIARYKWQLAGAICKIALDKRQTAREN